MRPLLPFVFFFFGFVASVYAQTGPGGVGATDGTSNLVLWLSADSNVFSDAGVTAATNGDNIQEWHDLSGYGNDATQTNATYQPTFNTNIISGEPVARFDGVDDFLDDNHTYTARTVFVVYRVSSATQNTGDLAQLWGYYGDGAHVAPEPRAGGDLQGFSFDGNGSAQAAYGLDGAATTTAASNDNTQQWDFNEFTFVFSEFTGGQSMTRQVIGSLYDSFAIGAHQFGGDIAEIIVYNNTLSTSDREDVERYLFEKYYYGYDASYGNDISGLNYSIAGSAQNELISSIITINNDAFSTGDYLFTGHDNAAASPLSAATGDLPIGNNARVERVWRADVRNSGGTVTFEIDISSIEGELAAGETFRLLVDTDDGDFSNALQYGGTIATSVLTIDNVTLDGDYYYTIGKVSAAANQTYYSYQDGDWEDDATWTNDPSGNTQIPVGGTAPFSGSSVVLLNGKTVSVPSTEAAKTLGTLEIEDGATLDLEDNTTSNDFGTISGEGILRLSSVTFPSGDFSTFTSASGGTIEFYDIASSTLPASQTTYNNLIISNSTVNSYTYTVASNLSFNGDVDLDNTGAGALTLSVGNNTTARTLTFNGNLEMSANSTFTTSTDNASHQFDFYGSIVNNGTITFENGSGRAEADFLGTTDESVTANNTTDFYNLTLNKGVDQTHILSISSTNSSYFDLTSGGDELFIENGTLKIESDVTLSDFASANFDVGSNQNANGALWIDGGTIDMTSNALVVYGLFRISSGTATFGQQGMVNREDGEIVLEGGTLNVSKYRISSTSTDHRGSFTMSGGVMNVDESFGNSDDGFAAFSMPFAEQSFAMSGGELNIKYAETSGTAINGGLQINADNYSVTGGDINVFIPNSATDFGIASKAPFWNLTINRNGTSGAGVAVIEDVNSDRGNVTATDLIVLNNFEIVSTNSPTFDANGFDVTVSNNFTVNTGASFTNTGSANTTTFNRNSGQTITLDASVTFDHLTVSTSNIADFSGTSSPTVDGDLTLTNGIFQINNYDVTLNGDLIINSAQQTGSSAVIINSPSASQTISGNDDATLNNLELNNTSGAAGSTVVLLETDLQINSTLDLTSERIFNLQSGNLVIAESATISGATGSTRMLITNGTSTNEGLTKKFSSSGGSYTYPIGTTTNYTPATINITNTDGASGSVTIAPINAEHPNVTASTSVEYYWQVSSTGFGASPVVTHTYDYTPFITTNGTEADYVYGRFDVSGSSWSNGATSDVTTQTIGGTGTNLENVSFIDGEFTAGETSSFGAVTVFYSRANGDWNTASTWSNDSHTGAIAATAPTASSVVIIGDGGSNNHTVTVDDAESASSVNLKLSTNSTLDLQGSSGNSLGVVVEGGGSSGFGTLRLNSNSFPSGDFSDFLKADAGTVEYYRNGSDFSLPVSPAAYNDLILSTDGGDTGVLTLPAGNLTIRGDLTLGTGSNSASLTVNSDNVAARDIDILGNLFINGVDGSNTSTFTVQSGGDHTFTVDGNITVSANSTFEAENAGSNAFTLTSFGNFINNGSVDFSTANSNLNLTFQGTTDNSITGTGTTFDINNLTLNKGVNANNELEINAANFSLGGGITLTNGTLKLTDSQTVLLANNSTFAIPSSASLVINGATAEITGTGNMTLAGDLTIDSGTLNIGTTNNNNYIQYSSAESPSITVNSGTLTVASQIRRPTATSSGNLSFTQTGGTVTVGEQQAPSNTRGVFEVLNNGSFTMSGGTLIVSRAQSTASDASRAALYLRPTTTNVTGGTIQIGDANTPASETIRINSTVSLYDLTINSTNSPTARLVIAPITVSNLLTINSGATFQANNLDLQLGGDFTNSGTFTPGTNTTTFTNSTASLDGATTFYNLIYSASGTLTLQASTALTVTNNLTISSNSGTVANGGNAITTDGDVTINGTLSGSGALVLNGGSSQTFSGDNSVSVSNLEINNASGVVVDTDVEMTGVLTLDSGTLNIQSNRLNISNTSASAIVDGIGGSAFSVSNMILTNGSSSDKGIRKSYPGSTSDFTFPVGVVSKYTPARINVTANSATGTVTLKPVNTTIVAATDDNGDGNDLLDYYWEVTSTGFSGLTATHEFTYNDNDVQTDGTSTSEGDYDAGRFLSPNWTSGTTNLGSINTTTNVITIDGGTTASNNGVSFISGTYTAGLASDEFQALDIYTSTVDGDWETDGTWDTAGQPAGNVVVIEPGDIITITSNSRSAATLDVNGTLVIGATTGHNFGTVTGSGTITINTAVFPGGDFSDFTSAGNGNIEYLYNGTLPTRSTYNNLTINTAGTSSIPNIDIDVLGDLTITSGTLSNSTYNRTINVQGDWTNNSGASAFTEGTGTVNFNSSSSAQSIGGSATTDFYDIEISNTSGSPVTLNSNATVNHNLTFTDGTLDLSANTLTANGDLINNASASALDNSSGTISLEGSATQTISGSFEPAFYNLTLNNSSANGVDLAQNITVANTLSFTDGFLNTTSSFQVTLNTSTGNLSGEISSSYIRGTLTITKNIGSGSSSFGNIGVSIPAGSSNLGNVTIKRVSGTSGIVNVDGKTSIARYWVITNTGSNPYDARNITYSWVANDDNGKDLSNFRIYKRPNEGSGAFLGVDDYQDISTVSDTRSITVQQDGFSQISGSDQNNSLPVTLTEFNVFSSHGSDNEIQLIWKTATETENYGFSVQRLFSETNVSGSNEFDEISFIRGHGNSTESKTYTFVDENLSQSGFYHYRLIQQDFDGDTTHYGPVVFKFENPEKNTLSNIYPNPFNPSTTVAYTIATSTEVSIELFNIVGQRLRVLEQGTKQPGRYKIQVDGSRLSSGVYFVRFMAGGSMETRQIVLIK